MLLPGGHMGKKKNSSGESKKFSLMQYKLRDWGASKVGQLLRPLSTSYSECSEAGAEQKMLSKARITHNVWHRRCRRGFWLSWQNKCVRGFSAQVSIIIVTWKYIVHFLNLILVYKKVVEICAIYKGANKECGCKTGLGISGDLIISALMINL